MSKHNLERTNWLGVCLVVIGLAYMSKNYHWDFYFLQDFLPDYLFTWPSFLIIIGGALLLFGRSGGLILMLIGLFFLFPHKIFSLLGELHQWWPLILITIGILILTKSRRAHGNAN